MTKEKYITRMPDGTVKQINPFSEQIILTVPGRSKRPVNKGNYQIKPIEEAGEKDKYCAFCPRCYLKTPPEKSRLVLGKGGKYKQIDHVKASDLNETTAEFRRIPNLFEIISYDFWVKNYGYKMPKALRKIKEEYISTDDGLLHIMNIIDGKMRMQGFSEKDIQRTTRDKKLEMADSFFAGGHELIVGRHHFIPNAVTTAEKMSSGEMSENEHYHFIDFTVKAVKDIYENNRYVKYVSIFQNWLAPAGASFDHLHKQLVAIDDIGLKNRRLAEVLKKNPDTYNDILNYAIDENLVIAENDSAVAIAAFGYLEPTIAVFLKTRHQYPWELDAKELTDFSDMLHACHAAAGNDIPCNEEWYYKPKKFKYNLPLYVLIRWRISTPAGFEAVTNIFINTIDPWILRNRMTSKLYTLRFNAKIGNIRISKECGTEKDCLEYNA